MPFGLDSRHVVSIVRQPILDSKARVFGYQLLYECGPAALDPIDTAAARTLSEAILSIGVDPLSCGRPLFVPLTRALLLGGAGSLLPPSTVIVLDDSITGDNEVVEMCRRLRQQNYSIAVPQFGPNATMPELLPLADYARVDLRRTKTRDWKPVVGQLNARGIKAIAERVENAEVAAAALEAGFSLLQGYYFCRPTTFLSTQIPARRLVYIKLLSALNRENVSMDEIEELVSHDLSLSVRVLRAVNSAAYGIRHEVTSLRHALVFLGLAQVRKWASVWAMTGLGEGDSSGLVGMSLVRARCCEYLGEMIPNREGSGYFLLGLCSKLDVILRRPMEIAIGDLPLPAMIRDALFGRDNLAKTVLDTIVHYERGEWDAAYAGTNRLNVNLDLLPDIYADAIRWARDLGEFAAAA
jgi:EAL and modified HD-GYP domain-containing signal transduction protein